MNGRQHDSRLVPRMNAAFIVYNSTVVVCVNVLSGQCKTLQFACVLVKGSGIGDPDAEPLVSLLDREQVEDTYTARRGAYANLYL